jgi:hypothetical protein
MAQFKYLEKIIIEFEKLLQEFGGEVIPCTQKEVDCLEAMLSSPYHLPAAYKEFLLYGGKKMAQMFKGGFSFSYQEVKFWLENPADIAISLGSQLPSDILMLVEHLGGYFEYLRLIEGDDPPVYSWREEDRGGLEVAQKRYDSFSEFLMNTIRVHRIHLISGATEEKLKAEKPPREQQIWYPTQQEKERGIVLHELIRYFGFYGFDQIDKAVTLSELASEEQYLEELSGWQAYQIGGEIRFFSPDTPAETIEQMNQTAKEQLKAEQTPRGRQKWYSSQQEQVEGISQKRLMRLMGFYYFAQLENAASLCGLAPNQYLEELSSWQARQVDGKTRFFPPKA